MDILFDFSWKQLFAPDVPVFESVIRGTVIYAAIFFLLRFIPNRQMGGVGMNDLLLVVLVASGATSALSGDYKSITSGMILVGTIIFWSYLFNWAGYRFPKLHRLFHPAPRLLVKDGEILDESMQAELLTEEELIGKLRRQGIADVSNVKEAYVESDGQVSAVTH